MIHLTVINEGVNARQTADFLPSIDKGCGLALLGLVVWNTIFGYVLARCSLPQADAPPRP